MTYELQKVNELAADLLVIASNFLLRNDVKNHDQVMKQVAKNIKPFSRKRGEK